MTHEEIINAQEALKELIYNNEELENIESKVNDFNIFNALGILNQEVRHSNFLGWLLDPKESHSLGGYFVKKLFKNIGYNDSEKLGGLTIFDIDEADYDSVEVYREWHDIDLLLIDEETSTLCVIENKIDSKEHSNQLTRYRERVETAFPNIKHKIYVYLTINGEEPERNPEYLGFSHKTIVGLIENLLKAKSSQLNNDIKLFIEHYHKLLTDYIMDESELKELCIKVYKTHKKAFDLIIDNKPDVYSDIKDSLVRYLKKKEDSGQIILDHYSKAYIRFIPKSMDVIPCEGEGWTKSKRILLFEIQNEAKSLRIKLLIGPGNSAIRESLYKYYQERKSSEDLSFKLISNKLYKMWTALVSENIIKTEKLEDLEIGDLDQKIEELFETKFEKLIKSIEVASKDLALLF